MFSSSVKMQDVAPLFRIMLIPNSGNFVEIHSRCLCAFDNLIGMRTLISASVTSTNYPKFLSYGLLPFCDCVVAC
jgi:hypothetical protein